LIAFLEKVNNAPVTILSKAIIFKIFFTNILLNGVRLLEYQMSRRFNSRVVTNKTSQRNTTNLIKLLWNKEI
jgi:hypothetical protein